MIPGFCLHKVALENLKEPLSNIIHGILKFGITRKELAIKAEV